MKMQNLTIPEEILEEIIGYLSPQLQFKKLLDYSLVSKSWLTIVRRTYFKHQDVAIGDHPPGSMRRVFTFEQVNDPRSTITPFIKIVSIVGPDTMLWNVRHGHGPEPCGYRLLKDIVEETTRSLRTQIVNLSISSLRWPSLTPGTIPLFSSFPNLRDLRLCSVRFGHISEIVDFVTPTNFPRLQGLVIKNCNIGEDKTVDIQGFMMNLMTKVCNFGEDTTEVDIQGQTFPTFLKHISIETKPRITLWLWSLKDQECQVTSLSIGTLRNREEEEAVKAIIRIAGPKLQHLSVDYTLSLEDDQPPLLLKGNSNLKTLCIGTFSALSRSSNAIRPICAILDSISSVKMSHCEIFIEIPLNSVPRILGERQEWSQMEDSLLSRQRQQGSTGINWELAVLIRRDGPNSAPLQRALRRMFTRLDLTGIGRLSVKSAERPQETGFEVWI